MKQHLYRITVEHLALPDGGVPGAAETLSFEAGSHDDLSFIVARALERGDLPREDATAFALGLKLFSEVMLKHRELPLFAEFGPHFKSFMKTLRGRPEL